MIKYKMLGEDIARRSRFIWVYRYGWFSLKGSS